MDSTRKSSFQFERSHIIKRVFDVAVTLLLLLLLAPVFALVGILVRIFMGSPVFFRQVRPGRDEAPFLLLKFRSMREAGDRDGNPLPDELRLGRFGKFLRSTSLDELPELWNVLVGEMSLVGPRPLLMEYLPLYSDTQRRRHEVRPGITGWAQVNGRNALSWENKFSLDVWYVDNRSLWLDVRILWMTLVQVIRSDGISQSGHVTAEKFRGGAR